MKWFNNLKIKTKLIVGFFGVAAIAALLGYVGITNVNKIDNNGTTIYENMTVPLSGIADISTSFTTVQLTLHKIAMAQSQDEIQKLSVDITARRTEFAKIGEEIKGSLVNKDALVAYDEFQKSREVYGPKIDEMLNLAKNGRNDQVLNMLIDPEVIKAGELEQAAIDNLQEIIVNNAKSQSDQNTAETNKAIQTMMIIIAVAILLSIGLGVWIARGITSPIKMLVQSADQLANGNLNIKLITNARDEVGDLSRSFARIIDAINALVADANMLAQAAVEGRLDTRADASKHEGDFRAIVEGVNETLDAVIGPLNVAAEYVERISRGNIPEKISDNYNGDFNEIKNNLNTCIDAVNALVSDANMLAHAAVEGKLDARADASKHGGDFRAIVEGVNNTLDAVIGPLNVAAEYVERISRGNIPEKITDNYNGDFNEIKNNLNTCIDAVNALVSDANMLAQAAVEGRLDTRADASKHGGDFRAIVEGVNETLDAVIGPLNIAAEYVDRISKGDIPVKIIDNYNGDFNEIKNNLNNCIDGLGGLMECCNVLKKMAINDYTSKVEGNYQGIFADTAEGVNTVRTRLLVAVETNVHIAEGNFAEDLEAFRKIGRRSEADRLIPSYIMSMENIQRLVKDTEMLSAGAIAGKLDLRADAMQHQGEYRKVIEGFNDTLDAVIGPLNVAAEYIERIGKGDTVSKITDNYNGDFNEIKNNINNCIDGLGGLMECCDVLKKMAVNDYTSKVEGNYQGIFAETAEGVNTVRTRLLVAVETNVHIAEGNFAADLEAFRKIGRRSEADRLIPSYIMSMENIQRLVKDAEMLSVGAIAGKLDLRADAMQHQGEYRKVIEGFNDTLDAVIGPLNVAAEYIERIGKGDTVSKITDDYNGDFNEIKNNINNCIDGLGGLIECSNVLKRMAVNDYTSKVEGHYQGVFAETAVGVNTVRDRLLNVVNVNTHIAAGEFAADLEAYRKVGRRSEEDKLVPSMIMSMENIQRLVKDAEMLSAGAIAGKLDLRADVMQHQGEYRKVIEGFNDTLDAVIGPLNVAAEYIERIANGNTPPKITDNYNGDFNEIKNNLNTCIDAITVMVDEINVAIAAGVEGRLDQRADADRCKGVYHKIISGVNATMDALIAPVNEAIPVVQQLAQGLLDIKMTGTYQGDNAKLKDAVNATIGNLADIIGEASDALGKIAQGHLDIEMNKDFPGNFASISSALKYIIESLNNIMGDINQAAEQVATESGQVSNSSQALAQGANEQASAIEQLTSAITEMAAQTRQNAANANQANELALNAKENASQGNERMKEMLDAMEGINDSSANISKIIKVIDEIAFQTNILALNAAVEAARAGQHGKGFAVVAEEVRNLAARSASAAKETTDLIEGSIRKVQTGTQIAHDTARALDKIVDEVSKAAVLVGDITVASNEQATGIAQVDQGISQVSQVVQSNSATAQQSAAASEELSQQAEVMKRNVAAFRLKRGNMRSSITNHYKDNAFSQEKLGAVTSNSSKSRIDLDDYNFGKY